MVEIAIKIEGNNMRVQQTKWSAKACEGCVLEKKLAVIAMSAELQTVRVNLETSTSSSGKLWLHIEAI